MSALFVDALKGYEFFLARRGKVSLDEINDHLIAQGRNPISQRTFGHYHKLLKHGFRYYIPINKFDVFQALGRLQVAGDRRRYNREKVEIPLQISRSGKKWIDAIAVDKSLVGFGIRTAMKFPVSPGTQILVRLPGHYDIPVIVVWRRHDDTHTHLGVRAFEFIAKYRLSPEQVDAQRLRGELKIYRSDEGLLHWDEFFRILEKSNELLVSVEDLLYSVGDVLGVNIHIARPVLQKVKFGSPGETQVKIDLGVAEIIKAVLEKVQYWGLAKRKMRAEVRRLEIENTERSLELLRSTVNLGKELQDMGVSSRIIQSLLGAPLREIFHVDSLPPELFEEHSLERAILKERVIPATVELSAGDDPDFDMQVSSS